MRGRNHLRPWRGANCRSMVSQRHRTLFSQMVEDLPDSQGVFDGGHDLDGQSGYGLMSAKSLGFNRPTQRNVKIVRQASRNLESSGGVR